MAFSKRAIDKNLRSLLCVSALFAVGIGGWACSSGSQQDSGTGASGNAGASDARGGNTGMGGNGSGADGGQDDTDGGADTTAGGKGSASGGSASTSGGAKATGGTSTAGTTSTGSTACDNGKDDDGDGLIDGFDPECTGPLDNDEGTFATGIPGDNRDPKWQDCFFDGNSGAGDDGCRYNTGCLTGELAQTDADCSVTDACIKFCAPLTQNGCDCFGCCTVQLPNGSTLDVAEVATCSLANLDDAKACPRCEKSTLCGNECGECELCAGKTAADLPASCSPPTGTGGSGNGGGANATGGKNAGGTSAGGATGSGGAGGSTGGASHTCDGGEQICGPGLSPCLSFEYCSFGCCILAVR